MKAMPPGQLNTMTRAPSPSGCGMVQQMLMTIPHHDNAVAIKHARRTVWVIFSRVLTAEGPSPHAGARRRWLVEAEHYRLAAVGAGGEHHPVRLDSHQRRGLQVEDDDDLSADERFRLVRFGQARH